MIPLRNNTYRHRLAHRLGSSMTLADQTYYLRRAFQEDEAARAATCEAARERHLELAAAYRFRCCQNQEAPSDSRGADKQIAQSA